MDVLLRGEVVLLLAFLAVIAVIVFTILDILKPPLRRRLRVRPARVAPRPPIRLADDRATIALRVSRRLIDGALAQSDPAGTVRSTLLRRAVACLQRGLETAPTDARLLAALAEAHTALGQTERAVA